MWVCLVLWCLWLIFLFLWLIFDFVSMGVCASEEEADDEGVGFADKEEREKKKERI